MTEQEKKQKKTELLREIYAELKSAQSPQKTK